MNLIKSHKKLIALFQEKSGLSDYGLLWLSFIKGIIITIIFQYLFL